MKKSNLAFGKKNYRLMLIGIAVLITGFILMSMDSEEFGFGVLGLWVGPLVLLAGFGIQFAAILTHDEVPVIEKSKVSATASTPTSQAKTQNKVGVSANKNTAKRAGNSKKRKKRTTK